MNIGALFGGVLAANIYKRYTGEEPYIDAPWWSQKSAMARWPRFLLWLIRKRTQRRHAGVTWVRFDDWLWDKYLAAIEKPAAANDNGANDNDGVRDEKVA